MFAWIKRVVKGLFIPKCVDCRGTGWKPGYDALFYYEYERACRLCRGTGHITDE